MNMRAKLRVSEVKRLENVELLTMNAVCKSSYDETGLDENNTFAKWSPSAQFTITVANPALHGQFNPGEEYYVDFTKAN